MKFSNLIIIVFGLTISALVYLLPYDASGFQDQDGQSLPVIDMSKIMSAAQNSTAFIEKTDRYNHYDLAEATMRPAHEKNGNATQEEYDLVYALYSNPGYCYFQNLLDVVLDSNLEVTNTTEYTLNNEPAGYPRPPVSCFLNAAPNIDYNRLLSILAPSPFATINETYNASSDSIIFSGTVHKLFSKYITMQVFNPHGDPIAYAQPLPEPDGTFAQAFHPFSPPWSDSGDYKIFITSDQRNLVEYTFHFNGVDCCATESEIHYADKGMPPFEQWKSYVPLRDTICDNGLQLVIKAEDSSPACVRPDTVQKLVKRGWALQEDYGTAPITEIKIEGIQQRYIAGQPIVVSVDFAGYVNGGIDPDVQVLDSNGTKVWDSCCFTHTETSIPYFHRATFQVTGPKIVNGYVNSAYPTIDKAGNYTMIASLENGRAEAKFEVVENKTVTTQSIQPQIDIVSSPHYLPNMPINFEIRINDNNTCTSQLHVTVVKPDGSTVWHSLRSPSVSCAVTPISSSFSVYKINDLGNPLVLNQTGNYTVHVDYGTSSAEKGFAVSEIIPKTNPTYYYADPDFVKPKVVLDDYAYDGIDNNDTTTVSINNQTYYQSTLPNDDENLPRGFSTSFKSVTFGFPEGTLITPGGAFVVLDVKFGDGSEEVYGQNLRYHVGGGVMGGIPIPTRFGPHVAENSTTVLGDHDHPQAGITIYHDRIKLLVSK